MGYRREGREKAIQFLFQHDLNPDHSEEALDQFWKSQEVSPRAVQFGNSLIRGVLEHLEEIDGQIRKYSQNWKLHRIAAVDRTILRLAIYEMMHRDDIPPVVSINEAIDIAKKFSTEESGKFVNGILDRIKADIPRPARTVAGGSRPPKSSPPEGKTPKTN